MKKLKCNSFSLDTVEPNPHCRKMRISMHHPMSHPSLQSSKHKNREQRWNWSSNFYETGMKRTKVTSCQRVSHPWCQNVTGRDTKCFQSSLKCKLMFNLPVGGKCKSDDPRNDLGRNKSRTFLIFNAYVILPLSLAPTSTPGWVVSYFSATEL